MKKHNFPKLFWIGMCLFFVSILAGDLSHALLNPPLEWVFWGSDILTCIAAAILVYVAVKAIRNRNKQ